MPDIFLGEFSVDTDPPVIDNRFPSPLSIDVALATNITFELTDEGSGVALPTLNVTIDSFPAIVGGVFQAGYTGSFTPITDGYLVTIDPGLNFLYGDSITVSVDVADLNPFPNIMPTSIWSFTTVGRAEPCSPLPLLPVELRMLQPYASEALEEIRRTAIHMVSTDNMIEHRVRGVLLTTYKNDFNAIFNDVLDVPAAILAERICKPRRLFEMDAIIQPLDVTLAAARQELLRLGCTQQYLTVIEARALGPSPQHRVAATCAIAMMAAVLYMEAGKANVTMENRFLSLPEPVPPPVLPVTVDQAISATVELAAPLTTVEERLRDPFPTRGLEELRRGVLQLVCGSPELDRRIRAVLLYAHQNDFSAIFADVLAVEPSILRETVANRRKLFAMSADLAPLMPAWSTARRELLTLGLATAYVDLLEARATSGSPQHRITAACATLLLAATLNPPIP